MDPKSYYNKGKKCNTKFCLNFHSETTLPFWWGGFWWNLLKLEKNMLSNYWSEVSTEKYNSDMLQTSKKLWAKIGGVSQSSKMMTIMLGLALLAYSWE